MLDEETVIWIVQSFHKSLAGRTFEKITYDMQQRYRQKVHRAFKASVLLKEQEHLCMQTL